MLKKITLKFSLALAIISCAATTQSSAQNNGLNLDGMDDHLSVTASPISSEMNMTFETWVNWTGLTNDQKIIDFGNDVSNRIYLTPSSTATGHMHFGMVVAGVEESIDAGAPLGGSVWHHVAITTTASGVWTLYVDGVQAAQNSGHTYYPSTLGATSNNWFGRSQDVADPYFEGTIDEVRIWNRALCQAEIVNDKDGELPLPLDERGLVAYYKLNEGTANGTNTTVTDAVDASNNSSPATLNNFGLTSSISNFVAGTNAITGAGTPYAPTLPSGTSETTDNTIVGSATTFQACGAIGVVTPNGGNPVTGHVSDSVWVESSVPSFYGQPYVARHYGIRPDINPSTATGIVTLFYTQADFTAYNADPNHGADMPVDATDALNNAANIRVNKRDGVSTDGTGLYGSYTGAQTVLTPTSVTWNTLSSRWEVSVDVVGFSGFFLNTNNSPLPLTLLSFSGRNEGSSNHLNWNTAEEVSTDYFDIQRSTDGKTFTTIGKVAAIGKASGSYQYSDNIQGTSSPVYYYKLKQVDLGGKFTYSNVVKIAAKTNGISVEATPNPFYNSINVAINSNEIGTAQIRLADITGKIQASQSATISKGANTVSVNTNNLSSGIYMLTVSTSGQRYTLKVVKN